MLALLVFFTIFTAFSSEEVLTIEEFAARPIPKEAQELTGEELAEYVNKQQPFFKAKYSPSVVKRRMASLMKMEYLKKDKRLLKVKMPEKTTDGNDTLPERSFLCLTD
ncbi:hypothetical protein TELCIR_09075 [Teladorsagia circumcincta]|uniref:Uncharacterized protein n=1 Tax=Teladorsagia circumcincta TaxID=45464 RepID=A0A2G9UFU5_TELCI|nr:hypothetical protein TELCIR_09075 [Teladorsagia circumcincta]